MSETLEKQIIDKDVPATMLATENHTPPKRSEPFHKAFNHAAAGRSSADLARAIGVSPPTVSRWRAGQIKPTPEALRRIDDALDTDFYTQYGAEATDRAVAELRTAKVGKGSTKPSNPTVEAVQKADEAIDDFLRGFGTKSGKAAKSIAEGELMTTASILPILSRVLDCLELVLRNLSPKSE